MAIAVLSLALAALLGFSIHRGSVCMVRGVAEMLSTGRAYMLLSFGKAVLWVLIVTTSVLWLVPAPGPLDHSWALSGSALAGGFLFGVGAAVNRGCAFSTLGRLGNGELGAMLTLGGFAVGAWSYLSMVTWWSLAGPEPLPATYDPLDPRTGVLVAALGAWGVWEIVRLWHARPAGASWIELVFARSYRLSAAMALIGVANGILYALHGPWTYTRTVNETIMAAMGGDLGPLAFPWVLFVAVVAGAVASAWQKGTFRLDWRPSRLWAQDFAGGLLMGIGAGMTPGGNDVLVLHSIPQLSAHALPAYLAMTAGIAMVLIGMRALSGAHLEVNCRGDVCRTRRVQASRAPWVSYHNPARSNSSRADGITKCSRQCHLTVIESRLRLWGRADQLLGSRAHHPSSLRENEHAGSAPTGRACIRQHFAREESVDGLRNSPTDRR